MVAIVSSMISQADYDSDAGELIITFKSNGARHAYKAPEDEFAALVAAPSAGKYFLDAIRGQFPERRL